MECNKWRELASEYIEGSLEPAMREAMADHTRTCAECSTDEAALREICRELNVLPEVDPPMFFRDNVISAIERQQAARPAGPWWKTLLPGLGRTAVGTLVAGGAAAAVLYTVLIPQAGRNQNLQQAEAGVSGRLLPGADAEGNAVSKSNPPRLRISRTTTVLANRGQAYNFYIWMENAQKGTARFQLLGGKESYRFNLFGRNHETLQVPFDVAAGKPTIDLQVFWTADGQSHVRHIFVPIPKDDRVPDEHQSFGLGQGSLVMAAREIAARYGRPVTLEDAPEDTTVQITARDETAPQTLERQLSPLGLHVTSSEAGVLVERTPMVSTPAPESGATGETNVIR